MRVCRVRESELSLLTNEADKFMFPRVSSSEVATDDDRQSTSEPADRSVDLPSSDAIDQRTTATAHRMNNTPSDQSHLSRDLDASNKRKRRKQLEAFLNDNSEYYKFHNPESRLRFQEAPFQPTLMCPTDDETNSIPHHDRSSTTTRQHASSSTSELCSSGRGIAVGPSLSMMCSSTATTSSSPWASPSSQPPPSSRSARHARQSQLYQLLSNPEGTAAQTGQRDAEDRKGASSGTPSTTINLNPNTYDKGHLLRTDVVKMHKFAFERVPSSEPWYEAFQRQDECRERVFEYWGSTCKSK